MNPLSFLILASCLSNVLTADSLLRLELCVDGYSSACRSGRIPRMRAGGLALIGLAAFAAQAAELPPEIERVLTGHAIPATDVSIVVQAVDDGKPLISHLADVAR